MKKLYTILITLSISLYGFNQCNMDQHNSTWFDGWISCTESPNPNFERGQGHWILYSFPELLEMHDLKIWNINAPDIIDYGIKKAALDYSRDGIVWVHYSDVIIPKGTGDNKYEGQDVFDFRGVEAKYLLITSKETYGSSCAGFAEMKLEVDSVKIKNTGNKPSNDLTEVPSIHENNDISLNFDNQEGKGCIVADMYPNPMTEDKLFLNLKGACENTVAIYSLTDAAGKNLIGEQQINLGQTIEILNGVKLSSGIYFIQISTNNSSVRYKIIKE